jgi:hypothetical protein
LSNIDAPPNICNMIGSLDLRCSRDLLINAIVRLTAQLSQSFEDAQLQCSD